MKVSWQAGTFCFFKETNLSPIDFLVMFGSGPQFLTSGIQPPMFVV